MLKSISSNWLRILVSVAVPFVLTPYLIRRLGDAGYDCWCIINSTGALLGLLLLGVPMTSVKFFAEHVARQDLPALNRAIASCLGMYLVLGLAALVAGGALFAVYEATQQVQPEWVAQGRVAFAIMVLFVGGGFVSQLPYGIMVAYHDFGVSNAIMVAGMLLRVGLTFAGLEMWISLPLLASIHLVVIAFEFLAGWWVAGRRYPGVRIGLAGVDRGTVRRILSFSVFVLLLNVGNKLAFHIDSLVIGAYSGEGEVTSYSNGNQFMLYLTDLMLGIGAVVMPLAVRLRTQGRETELRDIFFKWSKITLSLTLLVGLYLLALGPEFIGWWIRNRPPGPAGDVLQILTPSFFVFLPARAVALPILMGLGIAAAPSCALLAMGVLNLGLSLALVQPLGINGVAIGTAVPNVLFAAAVVVLTCRHLQVDLRAWMAYVWVRPLCGAVPVLGVLAALKYGVGIHGFVPLVLAGLVAVAVFGVVWALFVYRKDPYVDLPAFLARLRVRFARRPTQETP